LEGSRRRLDCPLERNGNGEEVPHATVSPWADVRPLVQVLVHGAAIGALPCGRRLFAAAEVTLALL
jgi:hypothetical protein